MLCIVKQQQLSVMDLLNLISIFLAAIFFLSVFLSCKNKNGLPTNWPLLGMLPDFLLHIHSAHERITEVLARSGCNFMYHGLWFSDMKVFYTADHTNVHYIMSSNFWNFPKGPKFLKMFDDILGDRIFNSDSELWKNQRRIAQAVINHQRFYKFLVKTSQDKVEKGLIPVLEHVAKEGVVVDLQDVFQRFTFDVTCILITGYDPGCLSFEFPEVEFARAMDDAGEAIFYRHVWPEWFWKLQMWLGIGQEQKLKKAWEKLDHIMAKYISRKRQEITNRSSSPLTEYEEGVDLLTWYMSNDSEIIGDDKFLRDTIINFLLAGRDTTSSALAWFFWLVSTHSQVDTKIREELKTIKKPENLWQFNLEELNNLVYLRGALSESLRLYPPVPFLHKAPVQEDILPSGHQVNPNMKIMLSSYCMGRMASVWGEDCLEFKPERWVSSTGKIKHQPSYKFFAFNAGPRTCLGKELAFVQMKVVAAAIIHSYNVRVVEGHLVAPSNSIILHMKHGLRVRISRRWN